MESSTYLLLMLLSIASPLPWMERACCSCPTKKGALPVSSKKTAGYHPLTVYCTNLIIHTRYIDKARFYANHHESMNQSPPCTHPHAPPSNHPSMEIYIGIYISSFLGTASIYVVALASHEINGETQKKKKKRTRTALPSYSSFKRSLYTCIQSGAD